MVDEAIAVWNRASQSRGQNSKNFVLLSICHPSCYIRQSVISHGLTAFTFFKGTFFHDSIHSYLA